MESRGDYFHQELSFSLLKSKVRNHARVRAYLNYYTGLLAGKEGTIVNIFLRTIMVTRRDYWWYFSLVLNMIMVKIVRIKNVRDQYPLLEPMHNQAQTSHSQPTHFV
ncbi:hypothetical protein BpHYR1_027892 [Brachionus plicatilis]|uniref:Uncharacterized protein n=1 Tax=Brachionus plicatilis TaxID=10195 RepID=A0A3M7PKL9_BRAPC|nr:hypothetical protein BpHYR1_027892 [Brachionus plicatilis]